jgi:hypothetical protein
LAELLLKRHEEYNLLDLNCEHMANFCKSGNFKSEQAEHARIAGAFIGIAVMAGILQRA